MVSKWIAHTATLQQKIQQTWKHGGSKDILVVLDKYKGKLRASAAQYLKKQKVLKFHIILKAKLQKLDGANEKRYIFVVKTKD